MARPAELELLTDEGGSVLLGWLAPDVLFVRFTGRLSSELADAYVPRLETLLQSSRHSVRYFSDASALTSYDLLARSAFVRMVLANRRALSSMVMLTWSAGVGPIAQNLAATLGDAVEVLTDPKQFDVRLLQAAPLAKQRLDPKTWHRVPTSSVVR
jgi:hypothetical protein